MPNGLRESLMSFLVVCGHKHNTKGTNCNYLIHPSVRIADHEVFAERLGEHLNLLLTSFEEESFNDELYDAWQDLQHTKPDITNYEDVKSSVISILECELVNIMVLNSKSPMGLSYDNGYNIIVGGNSLGRGITLPCLQTIYYCRKSKTPQADTYWQHSRMFGYDRIAGLLRIYSPPSLHKLFTELNNSNNIMINQIENFGVDGIQLIFPSNIKPTRSNVLDKQFINMISGGVNFFPANPIECNTKQIDDLLSNYSKEKGNDVFTYDELLSILSYTGSHNTEDWDNDKIINCVKSLSLKRPKTQCKLIVRRGRDITKGTGTLLSPTDRKLGDTLQEDLTLTMYRIKGDVEKGWKGNPIWIPNIKFPADCCFYDVR